MDLRMAIGRGEQASPWLLYMEKLNAPQADFFLSP